jgi:uncharacterized metal-binding protein
MVQQPPYACSHCAKTSCLSGDFGAMPKTCPTRTRSEVARDAEPYADAEQHGTMRAADDAPFTGDGVKRNRVEELAFYAKARGMKRVGIAFCVSLARDAQALGRFLREEGLEAELVCCRVGAIDREQIGLPKAHPERFSAICNPVAQARLLNERAVDIVAQVGLCLGHDMILQAECDAPVTTLVVKDRALDHHPIAALRARAPVVDVPVGAGSVK